ncbi:structural polyprotein [Agua Salud alphavirus]|nr:structural polyprotein [Agua Salud alphavirus]QEV83788.1 structural polyprotein [Agua Salud alphavirus]
MNYQQQPFYQQQLYAPPRRPQPWRVAPAQPPRARPNALAQQVQQLTSAVNSLMLRQQPAPRRRAVRPVRPAQPKKKPAPPPQKKKQEPPKKAAPQKKSAPKPGKRQRTAMKLEADKTFEVKDSDGQVTGYAICVEGRVMKPLHVKGTIDHPILSKLRFDKASTHDIEYAKLPPQMKTNAFRYTSEHPEGFYNWHHGAVQYSDGRFSIVTGNGGPGDSGRPILDNNGRVVAIVLGGANEGARTSLSVVTWKPSGTAVRTTPEGTVPWSAVTLMCFLGNVTFDCNSPPICYDEKPGPTLDMLEANVDNEGYWDLLEAVLYCPGEERPKRTKRAAVEKTVYHMTAPYSARCSECSLSRSCFSPIKIEDVWQESDDGTVRLQTSAQFGLDREGIKDTTRLRYASHDANSSLLDAPISALSVRTSSACTILGASGYFIVAKCPPGDSITASIALNTTTHSCTLRREVGLPLLGRERYTYTPSHGIQLPCLSYDPQKEKNSVFITVHRPNPQANSAFLSLSDGKVVVTPPAGRNVSYKCQCVTAISGTVTGRKTLSECNAVQQCIAALADNEKWVFNSPSLIRSADHAAQGKLYIPYPLTSTFCTVPFAADPILTYAFRKVSMKLFAERPTLLSTRNLGDDTDFTEEWITGNTVRNFTVTRDGFEYTWGNHAPKRLWSQESASGDPHGWPHQIVAHHYQRDPVWTVVLLGATAVAWTVAVLTAVCCVLKARRNLITPYALAPNAAVPLMYTLLCCVRQAKAESTADSLVHLWRNNTNMFYAQALVPIAALLILCRCCKCAIPFLLVAAAVTPEAAAFEHVATVPNTPYRPYRALVERQGYAPLNIEIAVTKSQIIPALRQAYITCDYSTVVPSPVVKCCGSLECTSRNLPDYQCESYSGVYPFLWGGAQCFCESENTQKSEAYVTKSPDCASHHAVAYYAQTASVRAYLKVTFGTQTATTEVFVNGVTPGKAGPIRLIAGPMSSAWSPFNDKIVEYRGKVFNYAFPEYTAGVPGAFGDVQMTSPTSTDIYANTNLRLLRPNTNEIHVPYTQAPSGFLSWANSTGPSLYETAPFACAVKTNPIRAEDCNVGMIPVSLDLPDAVFTRLSDSPAIKKLDCLISDCTYSADFGGIAHLEYDTPSNGTCPVHTSSSTVTFQESAFPVTGKGSLLVHFSTSSSEANFKVSLCTATTTCHGRCLPPVDHIVTYAHKQAVEFPTAISSTSWSWLFGLFGGASILTVFGLFVFAATALVLMCR